MENLTNCPGLHHVAEKIFFDLNVESLEDCKKVNESWELILKNPLFLKRRTWLLFRKYSQHKKFGNKNAWKEAIQRYVGTDHEKRLNQHLEKLYEHLEMCPIELKWCCMNMNNRFLYHFLDCPEFHELLEGCRFALRGTTLL